MTHASERLAQRLLARHAAAAASTTLYSGTFRHNNVEGTLALQFTPAVAPPPPPPPPPPPTGTGPTVPAGVLWQTPPGPTAWSDEGYNVQADAWSGGAGPQTTYAFSPADWGCIATEPAGNTAVLSYPDVEYPFYQSQNPSGLTYPALAALQHVDATYSEVMPPASDTYDAEAAFDLWCGTVNVAANDYSKAWAYEIMIWVENHGQTPGGTHQGTITVDGLVYDLWQSADESYTACVLQQAMPSGTIDVLAVLNALEASGHLPAGLCFTSLQFGWELCSTGGVPLQFECTNFAVSVA